MRVVVITGVVAMICTVLEISYEDKLEDTSADFIAWLQEGSSPGLDLIFGLLELFTGGIFVFISAMLYMCGNRKLGIMGLIAGILAASTASLLKMSFSHPRPFWKYPKIRGMRCLKDFGAPSGHAFSGGAVIFYLGYFWLRNGHNISSKVFILILAILITGFDRTYLGVHFYNQVLLGYSYSAFLASLLMRPFIDEFINKLAKNLKNVAISNIIAAVYLAVSICIYNFRDPSWDESWDVNYRQNCDHKLLLENALYKNLSETTLIFLIAGLLLGYYKLRDVPIYKFSYKVLFIAESLTSLLGLSVFGMEKLISFISNKPLKMLLISVDRYTGGYVLGYFIPLLIYKLVKPRVPALILSEDLKVELIKINNKS